jgi:hypothetical protein
MDDLPLAMQQEIQALRAALMDSLWELRSTGMFVYLKWAAETVQRLKLLYMNDPVAYAEFVKDGRHVPENTHIGKLDEDQQQFVVDVAEGLTGDEFVTKPLQKVLEDALWVTLED